MQSQESVAVQPYPTFLGGELKTANDVEPGSFVVSGAPFDTEKYSSRFGACMGPNGIRSGSKHLGERLRRVGDRELVDLDTGERLSGRLLDKIVDVGDFTMYPTDILRSQESIASGVAAVVSGGGASP